MNALHVRHGVRSSRFREVDNLALGVTDMTNVGSLSRFATCPADEEHLCKLPDTVTFNPYIG